MADQPEDKALEAEADLIEKEVAANQAEIPLDQPHPEELTAPRPVVAMPEAAPAPAEKTAPIAPTAAAEKKPEEKVDTPTTEPAKVAGYTAEDIVEAPVKPPQPEVTDTKAATKDPKVKFLVLIGAVLLAIGIVLFLIVSPVIGVVVAAIGGLLAIAAVFLPLHKMGKGKK